VIRRQAHQLLAPALEQLSEVAQDRLRFPLEPRRRDADHLDSQQLQLLLATAVALEGGAAAVRLEEIEFDREAQVRPVSVELELSDVEVHRRSRKAGPYDHSAETPLELRAREGGVRPMDGDRPCEPPPPAVPTGASQHIINRGHIKEVPVFGPLQVSLQLFRPRPNRQVKQRSRNGRDGGALANRPILLSQDRREMTRKVRLARRRVGAVTCITSGVKRNSPQR
jgi:hypothetical protein